MANPREFVSLGQTQLQITRLGLGSTALGFLYSAVDDVQANMTISRAVGLGLNMFDTAPLYGRGVAEARLGSVLSRLPRNSFVISTKVGYDIDEGHPHSLKGFSQQFYYEAPRDYSYDGVMRSIERSLKRLHLNRIDILHIHDADDHFDEAMNGAYKALAELRSAGVVRAIGAGMNHAERLARFVREGNFDCVLLAGRYTLLDQSAMHSLLPLCERKKISVLIGGVYNSGILANPNTHHAKYNYLPAAKTLLDKARRIDAVCAQHDIPIKAAAIQFPLSHSSVASVLCGARSQVELNENENMFRFPIPETLWEALVTEGLLPEVTLRARKEES